VLSAASIGAERAPAQRIGAEQLCRAIVQLALHAQAEIATVFVRNQPRAADADCGRRRIARSSPETQTAFFMVTFSPVLRRCPLWTTRQHPRI
jgi:hypothetical protein